MKHRLPIGTHVSFVGDSAIYVVDCYSDLLMCEGACSHDEGDCYTEPEICVRKSSWTARPLSQLLHVFDDPIGHMGRDATELEKTPIGGQYVEVL